MTVQSRNPVESQPKLDPKIIVAAIALVVLFVGWMGFHFLAPHQEMGVVRPLNEGEQWIKQKALESGGDMAKLSLQDQQKLILLKGDMGPSQLKYFAQKK